MDAVEAAVRSMEDNPLFNAGHGCALTEENTAELDALIMDGHSLEVGKKSNTIFMSWLALVVWKVDNSIHRINHYPMDSAVCFANSYLLDSDLSGG